MDPVTMNLILAIAGQALNAFFTFMRLAGKSDEEIAAIYASTKEQFLANNPATLPSVATK